MGSLLQLRWIGLTLLAMTLTGCAQLDYYFQAAQGQLALLAGARPIDDWLADPDVNQRLKLRLAKVKEIRQFAARELGLPDNNSYTSYTDLHRPYVLWNVVATPELSLQPHQWCFPIAGCVSYRGYYDKKEAQTYADDLKRQGFDVQVAGVAAYSTLGWFSDPVLSSFIDYPDAELARLVFHELAHQVVYAANDTRFNESFATAVEQAGLERWLAKHGDQRMRQNFAEYDQRKKDFLNLLLKHRQALDNNYQQAASDADKRRGKQAIFRALQADYQTLKTTWGGYAGYDRWFAEPLTNAHLSAVATYNDYVPAFRALLAHDKSLRKFYRSVHALAVLEPAQRNQKLARWTPPAPSRNDAVVALQHQKNILPNDHAE